MIDQTYSAAAEIMNDIFVNGTFMTLHNVMPVFFMILLTLIITRNFREMPILFAQFCILFLICGIHIHYIIWLSSFIYLVFASFIPALQTSIVNVQRVMKPVNLPTNSPLKLKNLAPTRGLLTPMGVLAEQVKKRSIRTFNPIAQPVKTGLDKYFENRRLKKILLQRPKQ